MKNFLNKRCNGKEGTKDSSLLVCNSTFSILRGIFPEDLNLHQHYSEIITSHKEEIR
jgi:hypothetical membrane protein